MNLDFEYIRYFIFLSVVVYFGFEYFDRKHVRDEREELIRLKTFEWVQKTILFSTSLLTLAYWLYPEMSAAVPIIVIILAGMYSEILGKLFFRQNL